MTVRVLTGDCISVLATLPSESAQCCVTSPPYFGLRDYGVAGQLGLEATPEEYAAKMVAVFREVRRVLRKDGTLWLNIGDSYANDAKWGGATGGKHVAALHGETSIGRGKKTTGLQPKDLIGIPWMLAFALRADGWWLRSDIVWAKPNCMPESVTDRPTRSHEYVFLMTKAERYYYDADAIKTPLAESSGPRLAQNVEAQAGSARANGGAKTNGTMRAVVKGGRREAELNQHWDEKPTALANARDVWWISPAPFAEAHFATMPPALAERCIRAGSKEGDVVLDPFGGAGTTGLVAQRLNRDATLIELNPAYVAMAEARIRGDAPLFSSVRSSP